MLARFGQWRGGENGYRVKEYTCSSVSKGLRELLSSTLSVCPGGICTTGEAGPGIKQRSMTTAKSMHKCEEDFIQNWVNTLRRMRENRTGAGRSVRCRKLDLSTAGGDGVLQHQKRVHFVRHGEGHHNVHSTRWFDEGKGGNPWEHPTCPIDPTLTDLGHEQARDLNSRGEALQAEGRFDPELVVVSPLRRTLQVRERRLSPPPSP